MPTLATNPTCVVMASAGAYAILAQPPGVFPVHAVLAAYCLITLSASMITLSAVEGHGKATDSTYKAHAAINECSGLVWAALALEVSNFISSRHRQGVAA